MLAEKQKGPARPPSASPTAGKRRGGPAATVAAPADRRPLLAVGTLVVLALGAAWVAGLPDAAGTLSAFSVRFLSIFIEAAPFLLLGTLVSGLIDVFVSRDQIARWVPRNPVLGVLAGVGLGFAFPVCECGVVPVVRRLLQKELPIPVAVTFLLAAPVMNPIVLVSTWVAFGWGPVLIGRFVITALVAGAIGLFFAVGAGRFGLEVFPPAGRGADDPAPTPRPRLGTGLRQALLLAGDEFFEMGRFVVIGCLLAAGLQTLVSQDTLLALGRGPLSSVLTMQALAFLLSVCSTVDAFIALAFVGTFSTGAILTFLTFGPMVDVKSTLLFLGVFSRRAVILLTVLPLLLTFLIGVILNLLGLF